MSNNVKTDNVKVKKSPKLKQIWVHGYGKEDQLHPNEIPLCGGDSGNPHDPVQVAPVDRFDRSWANGNGYRCPTCKDYWCRC